RDHSSSQKGVFSLHLCIISAITRFQHGFRLQPEFRTGSTKL
ncbi:unnamed protein product, partial [Allacma fusca]